MEANKYQGSGKTKELVRQQIYERWGELAAEDYDPYTDCRTYANWQKNGHQVQPGSIAVKSYIVIEVDKKTKEKVLKKINLFYKAQVKKI